MNFAQTRDGRIGRVLDSTDSTVTLYFEKEFRHAPLLLDIKNKETLKKEEIVKYGGFSELRLALSKEVPTYDVLDVNTSIENLEAGALRYEDNAGITRYVGIRPLFALVRSLDERVKTLTELNEVYKKNSLKE